jgi:hypothetical protein
VSLNVVGERSVSNTASTVHLDEFGVVIIVSVVVRLRELINGVVVLGVGLLLISGGVLFSFSPGVSGLTI